MAIVHYLSYRIHFRVMLPELHHKSNFSIMEENERLPDSIPIENNPEEMLNIKGTDETVVSQTDPINHQRK